MRVFIDMGDFAPAAGLAPSGLRMAVEFEAEAAREWPGPGMADGPALFLRNLRFVRADLIPGKRVGSRLGWRDAGLVAIPEGEPDSSP